MTDAKDIAIYDDSDDPVFDPENKEFSGSALEKKQAKLKLTLREEIFVAHYLIDFDRKRAAIAAGYKESGARQAAMTLVNRPRVARAIEEGGKKKLQAIQRTADDVLIQLQNAAFSDIRKVAPGVLDYLDDDTAAAVQSVKLTKRRINDHMIGGKEYEDVIELKMVDKNAATIALAKILGMMTDKLDINAKVEHNNVKELLDQIDGTNDGLPPDKA